MFARVLLTSVLSVPLLSACSEMGAQGISASSSAPKPEDFTPKAGLWRMRTTATGSPSQTVKLCVGQPMPGFEEMVAAQRGADCVRSSETMTDGAEFLATCRTDGKTVVIKTTVNGDMASNYRFALKVNTTGPDVPSRLAEVRMSIDARRLGDCPAGTQVGEIVE